MERKTITYKLSFGTASVEVPIAFSDKSLPAVLDEAERLEYVTGNLGQIDHRHYEACIHLIGKPPARIISWHEYEDGTLVPGSLTYGIEMPEPQLLQSPGKISKEPATSS